MSNDQDLDTNSTVLTQQIEEYNQILACCEHDTVPKWNEIQLKNDKTYVNQLLHLAVRKLILKVRLIKRSSDRPHYAQDTVEALSQCENEVSVVLLMAKDADLCSVNEQGNKPVDCLLSEVLGRKAVYNERRHQLIGVENSLPHLYDELAQTLLCSLLNKNILNSAYKWDYSYFSVFILLSWWNVVRWGLDAGADVSDNGVCRFIPLHAAFIDRIHFRQPAVPRDVFARLIHPTNANRPSITDQDNENNNDNNTLLSHRRVLPLHKAISHWRFYHLIPHLVNAGACLDIRNHLYELPMEEFIEQIPHSDTPTLFHLLIPKSVGIHPDLFLKIVHKLKEFGSQSQKAVFASILCEHLRLSSGWIRLSALEDHPSESEYSPGFVIIANGERWRMNKMCVCEILCVIETLKQLGIRARLMPDFTPAIVDPRRGHIPENSDNQQKIKAVKKAWNEYKTLVPSLFLQCVREIRSALQTVTDEKVKELPIPPGIQDLISLKPVMEKMMLSLEECNCSRARQ